MWDDLQADLARYPGAGLARLRLALESQGFWAVAAYRLGRAIHALPRELSLPLRVAFKPVSKAVEIATGIQIPLSAEIGPGLYIGHFGGIILSSRTRVGARCNLSQGVTLGRGQRGEAAGHPVVGARG
jgi:serine O-acetyltransferase